MTNSANKHSNSLLNQFLENGRSDESFTRLVKATGGLVYGSALRRTQNESLADEVTQNVFIILARKAESLRKHPSINAWLYRTTSYEAEKVLRKEKRHQRRVEKFVNETIQDHSNSALSQEALCLLDQAIDKLSEKDRALLLARFFEQKKFREIASSTGQSEAACKVRIRRVMDKMANWLNARGCTLSIATLSSNLTNEWSRPCPAKLLSQTCNFLKTAAASSSLIIPSTLATMKTSKIALAGVTVLIGAVTTHFIIKHNTNANPDSKSTIKTSFNTSEKQRTNRAKKRSRSIESQLTNYPYAYKRLEELYKKYPNLYLPKFVPATEPTIVDALNEYCENLKQKNAFRAPDWVRAQLRGKEEWDQERMGRFLAENDEIISRFLEISKLSTQQAKFLYKISESCPEILNSRDTMFYLQSAFLHSHREADLEKAKEIYTAINRIQESIAQPFLVHSLMYSANEGSLLNQMINLAQDGHDISPYLANRSQNFQPAPLINALRMETAALFSFIEAAKPIDDRQAMSSHFVMLMNFDQNDQPPLADQRLMEEAGMTLDMNEFQDYYAKVISDYISKVEQWDPAVDPTLPLLKVDISQTDLPRGQALILNSMLPPSAPIMKKSLTLELSRREAITWNAINQARSQGLEPTNLSELVPEFLPEIPVNPMDNKPLVFDSENKTLNKAK